MRCPVCIASRFDGRVGLVASARLDGSWRCSWWVPLLVGILGEVLGDGLDGTVVGVPSRKVLGDVFGDGRDGPVDVPFRRIGGCPLPEGVSRRTRGGCPFAKVRSSSVVDAQCCRRPVGVLCRRPATDPMIAAVGGCPFPKNDGHAYDRGGRWVSLPEERLPEEREARSGLTGMPRPGIAGSGRLQLDERPVAAVRITKQALGRALFDDPSVL